MHGGAGGGCTSASRNLSIISNRDPEISPVNNRIFSIYTGTTGLHTLMSLESSNGLQWAHASMGSRAHLQVLDPLLDPQRSTEGGEGVACIPRRNVTVRDHAVDVGRWQVQPRCERPENLQQHPPRRPPRLTTLHLMVFSICRRHPSPNLLMQVSCMGAWRCRIRC